MIRSPALAWKALDLNFVFFTNLAGSLFGTFFGSISNAFIIAFLHIGDLRGASVQNCGAEWARTPDLLTARNTSHGDLRDS